MIKSVLLLLVIISCSCDMKKEAQQETLTVSVTNYPLYWVAGYIAGNTAEIVYTVPSGIDPAYWEPQDADIKQMQQSDIILINGATYEKWLNSVELSTSKIVDTSKSCQQMLIHIKDAVKHEHNGKEHSHDGIDFNTWLDAYILSIQAQEVANALSGEMPQHKELYDKNLLALKNEIKSLFIKINEAPGEQKKFLASHPVYNYLAKANGWELINFHWEPNEMPADSEWIKLKEAASFSKYMLFEDLPSLEIQQKLKSHGVNFIVFRTCGNTPPAKDFLKEMKLNLENLEKTFK